MRPAATRRPRTSVSRTPRPDRTTRRRPCPTRTRATSHRTPLATSPTPSYAATCPGRAVPATTTGTIPAARASRKVFPATCAILFLRMTPRPRSGSGSSIAAAIPGPSAWAGTSIRSAAVEIGGFDPVAAPFRPPFPFARPSFSRRKNDRTIVRLPGNRDSRMPSSRWNTCTTPPALPRNFRGNSFLGKLDLAPPSPRLLRSDKRQLHRIETHGPCCQSERQATTTERPETQ